MVNLKRFSVYSPETEEQRMLGRMGVTFLKSEEGYDWYEAQKLFSPDTIKFCYDDNNVICSITSAEGWHDVSTLWPLNLNVAEIPDTEANRRVDISCEWQFVNGEVIPRVYTRDELIYKSEKKKTLLLKRVSDVIAPMQDAFDLGIATDEEVAKLKACKKYRVLLSRIDVSAAPNIEWPTPPEILS